jgi:hypothetical protein
MPNATLQRRLELLVAGMLVLVGGASFTQAITGRHSERWRTCAEAVAIVERRTPDMSSAPDVKNRAAQILRRLWRSRPDLQATFSANGGPDIPALAAWIATVPDVSALPVSSCVQELSDLVDSGVSLARMRTLASLVEWTRVRSKGSFGELEANRNAAYDLFVAAAPRLVDPENQVKTGAEIVEWAWRLPPSDASFDAAWRALDDFSVSEDD